MIKETAGNLFEAKTEAIINAVNTVGVMGKGLAWQFRQRFSDEYFKDYQRACQNGDLRIGRVQIYQLGTDGYPKYIINFPTKRHWREKSRIEYVENGLENLAEVLQQHKIKSVAMPALGCGLGGLEWADVKSLIEKEFADQRSVEVLLFEPAGF
ncbi:MAG: macro domain-containing protein [Pyrinomonadaceae bacterium]